MRLLKYILLLALLPAWEAAAEPLAGIRGLARAGARQLALQHMARLQPEAAADPVNWMVWERERIAILEAQGDWAGVIRRLRQAPPGLPPVFRRWALTRQAEAELELGRAAAARALLRALLWEKDAAADAGDAFPAWRRLIVRSYLLDGRTSDAAAALLRYRQDYGAHGAEERLLQARVWLLDGRSADAWSLLEDMQDEPARAMRLLAGLRSGSLAAGAVQRSAAALAGEDGADARARAALWAVAAEAAGQRADLRGRIQALERGLAQPRAGGDGLFALDADALWDAYLAFGRQLGNQRQWLVGDHEAWQRAASAAARHDPLQARALFAVLAYNSAGPRRRAAAHEDLAALCEPLLMQRLYQESRRFPSPDTLPAAVRYRLVDEALAAPDLAGASRLMAGFDAPPPDADPLDWQLRRARVLILAGESAQGAEILRQVPRAALAADTAALDRYVQVIFDLQTAGEHERALGLLSELPAIAREPRRHRELLFWMADSHEALGRHETAGELYLRSATLGDPLAMDSWAQTARYHAAAALARAGLGGDARRLYQGLLDSTADPARQAVLRHKIQQLPVAEGGGS